MTEPSFSRRVPPGDTLERRICDHCGFTDYQNPKIVVGSVVRHEGRILLCRRAIEPRRGFWTIPAGYLELNESPEEGARREAREEAGADLVLGDLLAVYSVTRLSQVQLIYRATLRSGEVAAGPESLEVAFFAPEDIPYHELAFPSVHWALEHDRRAEEGSATPFANPFGRNADKLPDGTRMSDEAL